MRRLLAVAALALVCAGAAGVSGASAQNCPYYLGVQICSAPANPYPCNDNPGYGGWYEYAGFSKGQNIPAGTSGRADVAVDYDWFPQSGHVAVWMGVVSSDHTKWIQAGVADALGWAGGLEAYVEWADGQLDANGNPVNHYIDMGDVSYGAFHRVVITHDSGTFWRAQAAGLPYPLLGGSINLNFTGSLTQYTSEEWQAQYSDGGHCQYLAGRIANITPYTTGGMGRLVNLPDSVSNVTSTGWSMFQQ